MAVVKSSNAELLLKSVCSPRPKNPKTFRYWGEIRGGMFRALASLTLLAAVSLNSARAVDFHVAKAQDLQNALYTAAHNGANNNIYITNGYYVGNFNYNSSDTNNLTVLAEPGVTNAAITIDGGGAGSALSISTSANLNSIRIQGLSFAINGGYGSFYTLPIQAGSQASIAVSDCRFFSTNSAGDGLYLQSGGNFTVDGCVFAGTTKIIEHAITYGNITGNLAVQNCSISGAYYVLLSDGGYGLNFVAISNNIFTGNVDVLTASGSHQPPLVGMVNVSSNIFNGNGQNGGGGDVIGFGWYASVTINGNTFTNNSAEVAIIGSSSVVVAGNTFTAFTGNAIQGVYVEDDLTPDYGNFYVNTAQFAGNYFIGNTNSPIHINLGQGVVTFEANTFKQNTSGGNGGELSISAPSVTFADNLVVGNTQTNASSTGGGVWVNAATNLFFINNTISGNYSAGAGGGAAFQISDNMEVLNVFNNIIWGNTGSPGADVWLSGTGQERIFSNNDAHDLFGIWDLFENNLDVDPQFVSPTTGNYRLQSGSPCIGAGTVAAPDLPTVDLDGNPRIANGTVDLGCYELGTTAGIIIVNISRPASGVVMLKWPSVSGANYIVQESTDLKQGFHNWTGTISATPPMNTYSDSFQPGAAAVYYRIIVQ